MASLKTKFFVGLFVIIGIAIAVATIIWVGMSHYFEKGHYYAAYFDESVQGLDKDSPVKFRGVSIGRVQSIGVAPDAKLIRVILKIETDLELEKNIYAQLKSVGITGIMFVELERMQPGEPDRSPKINFESRYPVIATRSSDISKIIKGIDGLITQFRRLDFAAVTENLTATLDKIDRNIDDIRIKEISERLRSTLDSAEKIMSRPKWDGMAEAVASAGQSVSTFAQNADRTVSRMDQSLERLDKIFVENEKGLKEAIEQFKITMTSSNQMLKSGIDLIQNADAKLSSLERNLTVTLQNLESASENLNRYLERIADQPAQLLFGNPPPTRQIDPKK
ncbi:MAG: MlaD family protein [Desulfobacterales bacterium]|nr:MlaD family protein [Desulfobacterales bacterium]